MKFLLVLAVVALGVWLWRHNRTAAQPDAPPMPNASPEDMVRCRVCGTHLPRSEAVSGSMGDYCGPEHAAQERH